MKRMGWFLRTLLGYFLLAALLLAGVGIPVSGNVRSLVYEEILSNAQGVLESMETVFADWMRGMEEYAYQVRGDVQMNPYVLQDDGYAALNAVRELSKTVTYSNACESIVLVYAAKYFSGLPRVYTSQNYTDAQRYFAYFYRYDQWSLESLYAEMESLVAPVLRGPEMVTVDRVRREAYMTYVVPLGASSSRNQRGVMLFLTPASQLIAMLREINLPEEATLVLADAQGQVLLSSGSWTVPQAFVLPGEGATQCQVADEACLLLQGSGEACGVRLALLLNEGEIAGMMRSRLTNILLILLAGLLLAVGASLVLSTLVFRPVRRLAGIARSVGGGVGGKQHSDEFEHIERTIRQLHANNADLLSRLHSQSGMLRQHLLRSMCLGQGGAEKFLALLREDGIAFSERSLRVLILRIDNEALFESRMDASLRALTRFGLLKVLRESMGARQIVAVGCEMGVDNDIVALLSGAVQEEYGLEAALEQVRGIAAQHFGLTLSAGISAGFGGLDGVCEAYGSALRAVEQRFLEGGGKDFFAGRLPDFAWDETLERQLTRLEARVAGALRAGNYAQCAQALDTYAQEMRAAHDPSKARQRALLLYASLCQQLQMSEMGASSLPLEMHCQYETLEQMRDDLHRALRVLQERHSGQQETQRSELVDNCVRFMREHLADETLTMDSLAAALSVSAGYLSRCFREQMGFSPWQYFDDMRMQHACALLKGTSLRIGDILEKCGYVDKANFMRKFKREFGMTPMEYRRANAHAGFTDKG